jgi:hypothetical protein
VGVLLGAVLPPAARRRGLAEAAILAEWATIVGPELAARCRPLSVRSPPGGRGGAVLELASGAAAALELQHAAPQLIERVNGHLGFPAVARLRLLRRAPTPPAADAPAAAEEAPDPAVAAALESELADATAALPEGELRAALMALGRTLLRRPGRRR